MLSLLLSAGVSIGVAPARAELDKKAAALVQQLGDPVFRKREAAARDLADMGRIVIPVLEAASKNPDIEIRDRAKRLVPLALQVDVQRQIARFLDDKSGTASVDLPSWKLYRRAVGDDGPARKFFIDAFQNNLDLLQELEINPLKAWQSFNQRTMETQLAIQAQWNLPRRRGKGFAAPEPVTIDIHQFAALMLIGMDDGVQKAREKQLKEGVQQNGAGMAVGFDTDSYPLAQFMGENYFREYVTSHPQAPQFKKLFLEWLEAQARFGTGVNNYEMYSVMEAIKNTRLRETVGFVERVVNSPKTPAEIRGSAIICLGAFGDKKHLEMLAPLLKDKTQVSSFNIGGGNGNKEYKTELRDVALGMTIKLNGERPSQYGFEGMTVFGGGDDNMEYYSFSFTSDEKRAATFKKWDDFVAHGLKEKKEAEAKEKPQKK